MPKQAKTRKPRPIDASRLKTLHRRAKDVRLKPSTSRTSGGKLRRLVNFTETEWAHITEWAHMEGRSAVSVIREAVCLYLDLGFEDVPHGRPSASTGAAE
jgi:hypothetical protein